MHEWGMTLISVFGVYIVSSTVGFVWWMSHISTVVEFMAKDVKQLTLSNASLATKEDVAKEFSWRDKRLDEAWLAIEDLRNDPKDK